MCRGTGDITRLIVSECSKLAPEGIQKKAWQSCYNNSMEIA